jgi:hypothetical protein
VSASYFSNFPYINYANVLATNITLRTAFIQSLKQQASVFYPYTIEESETADAIASWYYGRPDYDWLVYLANDIIDPHTQWPKTYLQLQDYVIKKYGSLPIAQSTILFYRKNPDINYLLIDGSDFSSDTNSGYDVVANNTDIRITPESIAFVPDSTQYYPVYAYDYENELNEEKRNILLIDNKLKSHVTAEMNGLLNG